MIKRRTTKKTVKKRKKTKKRYAYKRVYNERRAHYLPEWKELGAKIKACRLNRGLTSQEMANRLGKSPQYYGHIEQGYNDPRTLPTDTKKRLARILEMTYEGLWGD